MIKRTTENGYGVNLKTLSFCGKEAKFKEFVLKHAKTIGADKDFLKNINATTDEEFVDDFYDYTDNHGEEGPWGFVAQVMQAETGIRFKYCHGNDYGEAIMFPSWYPWSNFTPEKKELAQEDLDEIFDEYFEELGFDEVETDYVEVGYLD